MDVQSEDFLVVFESEDDDEELDDDDDEDELSEDFVSARLASCLSAPESADAAVWRLRFAVP